MAKAKKRKAEPKRKAKAEQRERTPEQVEKATALAKIMYEMMCRLEPEAVDQVRNEITTKMILDPTYRAGFKRMIAEAEAQS